MLTALIVLLVCQLAGTAIEGALSLPVPGAVIGMVILFLGLLIRGGLPEGLQSTTQGLLDHLSLLFVPAGVGVMQELSVIQREWLPIAAAVIGSCIITIAVTGLVMQFCVRFRRSAEEKAIDETRQ